MQVHHAQRRALARYRAAQYVAIEGHRALQILYPQHQVINCLLYTSDAADE